MFCMKMQPIMCNLGLYIYKKKCKHLLQIQWKTFLLWFMMFFSINAEKLT